MNTELQHEGGISSQCALLVDPHTGQEFSLTRFATSVGRSISSDIILADKSVSRQHAIIYYLKGQFLLEDLGSTNGTLLNGKQINTRAELVPGDEIKLGITKLLFLLLPDSSFRGSIISQDPTQITDEDSVHPVSGALVMS